MKLPGLETFREIWFVDFEFHSPPGEQPQPICMVAREWRSNTVIRLWGSELVALDESPIPHRDDVLFVAYYASAEIGCYLALGWTPPPRILDLFVEFRRLTNGFGPRIGNGLLDALEYCGLPSIETLEKTSLRNLAIRGGPFTETERQALLDYCASDVDALAHLLPAMVPKIDLPTALIRGRYMIAAARMEWTGVPIDTDTLNKLLEQWEHIKLLLVREIDKDFNVFDGTTFKIERWVEYLNRHKIPWPRTKTGRPDLKDETFRQMSKLHPQIAPLRELRYSLSQMRLKDLEVGADGRNRRILSAFRAKTSRNQPSSSRFIFGPSVWIRGLIKPDPGQAIAYVDYEQQEFGIAAALSGDAAMIDAYRTGDPYLRFAVQAGAAPPEATKGTHGPVREQFKMCALGVQYGMGENALATSLQQPVLEACRLLQLHRDTYPTFWKWSQAAIDYGMLHQRIHTVLGWQLHVGPDMKSRTLANFPMQANGAEMLRLACCLATERGIQVCAPVHDALLIEAPDHLIDDEVSRCRDAMREASEIVLDGFALRCDAQIVRYPDRYMDSRGKHMWETVMRALADAPEFQRQAEREAAPLFHDMTLEQCA